MLPQSHVDPKIASSSGMCVGFGLSSAVEISLGDCHLYLLTFTGDIDEKLCGIVLNSATISVRIEELTSLRAKVSVVNVPTSIWLEDLRPSMAQKKAT